MNEVRLLLVALGKVLYQTFTLLLRTNAIANIAENPDIEDPEIVDRFAHGEIHRKGLTGLALANDLTADADDLSLTGALVVEEILVVFVVIGIGHKTFDVAPDDLLGRVSEDALAGRIEHRHFSAGVHQDDAVDRGIKNCA